MYVFWGRGAGFGSLETCCILPKNLELPPYIIRVLCRVPKNKRNIFLEVMQTFELISKEITFILCLVTTILGGKMDWFHFPLFG